MHIYVYVYTFTYMCIYMYKYIYSIYAYMFIYIYTCIYICIYMYIHIYLYKYIHLHIYTYIHMYIHTQMYICLTSVWLYRVIFSERKYVDAKRPQTRRICPSAQDPKGKSRAGEVLLVYVAYVCLWKLINLNSHDAKGKGCSRVASVSRIDKVIGLFCKSDKVIGLFCKRAL